MARTKQAGYAETHDEDAAMKKPASKKTKAASVGIAADMPSVADEKRWRVEEAMRTINRAEELKKDRGLMSDVKKAAMEQAKRVSGFCGKAK